MRILHTSDWHLGRTFHGASLLDEQADTIDRIVALTIKHEVDLVIVAGDLYDRSVPPASAVDLFDDALARLHGAGARVAAISGNHDSAIRVGVSDRLLNQMGVAVRGDVRRIADPLMIDEPADGGPPVAVYLVPFLEPSVDVARLSELLGAGADASADASELSAQLCEEDLGAHVVATGTSPTESGPGASANASVASEPGAATGRATHDRAMRLATEVVRRHLATLGGARSVVVAHGFVAGGFVSDSERDLSVGGTDRVAVSAFDGFDLVTLGHLHQPQRVAGDRIAYSGTPLPYSFSEQDHVKSVRLIDLAPDGSVTAEIVPLGVGRPLRTIAGELADLLADPTLDDAVEARVRVVLTDAHLPNAAMARLRTRFLHAVELRHEPAGIDPAARHTATELATLESLSPLALTTRFWTEQQGAAATDAELALLTRAVATTLGVAEDGAP